MKLTKRLLVVYVQPRYNSLLPDHWPKYKIRNFFPFRSEETKGTRKWMIDQTYRWGVNQFKGSSFEWDDSTVLRKLMCRILQNNAQVTPNNRSTSTPFEVVFSNNVLLSFERDVNMYTTFVLDCVVLN